MQRYYLVELAPDGYHYIYAEGVLFESGCAATSFIDPQTAGVQAWPSMDRGRAIHVGKGGRVLAWSENEIPPDVEIRHCTRVVARYPEGGVLVAVYLEGLNATKPHNLNGGPSETPCCSYQHRADLRRRGA